MNKNPEMRQKDKGNKRTQYGGKTCCGRLWLTSFLGVLTAVLLLCSGLGSVCAMAGTIDSKTKVIKTRTDEEFARETAKLVKQNRKISLTEEGKVEKYSSGRLIARIKNGEKANLTSYGADTIIQSSFGVNVMQFSTAGAAGKAAAKIAALPALSYVEADDTSIDVGDTKITKIEFEGSPDSEDSDESEQITGTDEVSLQENPTFTGNTEGDATGFDIGGKGKDLTYDSSIKSGASAVSASSMSWGVSYMKAHLYAKFVKRHSPKSIKVAVVDSGVTWHEKLSSRIRPGLDLVDNDKNPDDTNGHGTHVAGTIVDCTPGLEVNILPVRVMDSSGMGNPSAVGNGIRYAVNAGAKVINLSLGGDTHYKYLEECISYANKRGVTIVIAAGNSNEDTRYSCPAHLSAPIIVSAIDRDGTRPFFSNFGSSVDVAAPGVDIVSCWMNGGYAVATGTSMAAPHISAVAAMFRMLRPNRTPAAIQKMVKSYVKDIGPKGRDKYYGYGAPLLTKAIPPAKVTLNKKKAVLTVSKTMTLKAAISPSYARWKSKLTWASSNSKVVSVSGGKIKAKKPGTVTITVRTESGKKASCRVKVEPVKPSSVKLNARRKTLKVGQKFRMTATVSPSNAGNKKVTWISSKKTVATVSSAGIVTARKAGVTYITAKTVNGKKASCKVTVAAP